MKSVLKLSAAAGLAALSLAACATPTPYQPRMPGTAMSGGYTDQQVAGDRFRVTFAGNSLTSRETVERYLLFRAAELTVDRGFDWFELADRHTDRSSRTYVEPDPFMGPGGWGYWHPYWRYYGRGYGWRTWDPFWGDPFWANGPEVTTVNRYEASAEIIVHRGPKPAGDPHAIDARDVMEHLGPTIQRPTP